MPKQIMHAPYKKMNMSIVRSAGTWIGMFRELASQ